MKLYLKNIVNQLRNYSISLDKGSLLIDKPWALIDDESEMQKLIFKKNNELIMSKNGQVQIGKWEYFPEAKSLLIDRNTDKILCNEAFIDKGVMILKLDGTDNRFFILANENIIPDLDTDRYLKQLRNQKLKITEQRLVDGRILEISRKEDYSFPSIGNCVTIEASPIDDGKYQMAESEEYYDIKNGKIYKILISTKYVNPDKHEIVIHQHNSWGLQNGDEVFMFGKKIENSCINFSIFSNLIVRDGKVVRLEKKNPFTRYISKIFKKMSDNYYE